MDVILITMMSRIDLTPACSRCVAVRFLSFPRVSTVSHMGKNNGNPDLVCKKKRILHECSCFIEFIKQVGENR